MSIRYRDHNGYEAILGGLTPGGNLETGAVATRQGTITIPSLAANTVTATEITFSEPMPDNNYEVTFTVSSLSGPQGGNTLFMPFSKTPNGFILAGYNGNSAVVEGTTLVWKAFKLYEVADAEALYSTVQDIEKAFPADASSSNKLATIRDVTSETRSLDRRIDDLEDYMPSDVSISNKVATQADLANVSIDELGDIEDVDLDDVAEGETLVWDSTNSKWVNGAGGKTYTAGDGITISNTDEISAKVDDTSITTDTNDALKVADTYKTTFVGTRAQWDTLSSGQKALYDMVSLTDDGENLEVIDAVTDGDMRAVSSNAVADQNYLNIIRSDTLTTSYGTGYQANRIAKVGDHLYSINGSFSSNSHMSGVLATFDKTAYPINSVVIPCALYDTGALGWTTGVLYVTTMNEYPGKYILQLIGTNGATNIQRVCFSALIYA